MAMDPSRQRGALGPLQCIRRALGVPFALFALGVSFTVTAAPAEDRLVQVPTRGTQLISYWWMPKEGAAATVVLFSGGTGGIGYRDARPQSSNFLIRSRERFRDQDLNVALVGNPSDRRQLDDAWRTSSAHADDVAAILGSIRQQSAQPVWLIGTSRGTVSAAALAVALSHQIAGVVLTASITSTRQPAAVALQAIDNITLPVLVYHHKQDACPATPAQQADEIMSKLKRATVKRLMIVNSGDNPTGDPCEALHWHGFIGMEAQAAQDIGNWIKNPQP